MKVYVVQSSFGEYEDSYTYIDGIYSSRDIAEIDMQKTIHYYNELSQSEDPYDDIEYDNLSSEEQSEIDDNWGKWIDAKKFNCSWITEYELINK